MKLVGLHGREKKYGLPKTAVKTLAARVTPKDSSQDKDSLKSEK
ncbi:MAG: hypothetical protein ACRC6R_04100 [Bacteroidales bacterium]